VRQRAIRAVDIGGAVRDSFVTDLIYLDPGRNDGLCPGALELKDTHCSSL